jgi:ribosome-associated toxin RatA of RatAB toxin-antitoxin module
LTHKFGTVDAPVAEVHRCFSDIESWPQWMPGVRAIRVLERSGARALVELDRSTRRRRQKTTAELVFTPNGLHERQVTGPIKEWDAKWRFQVGPGNAGTLVSCQLELDLGFIGLFVPAKSIERWIDRTFEKVLQGVRDQLRLARSANVAEERAQPAARTSRIQVFATPTELEIWIDDRKYVAHAAD